MDSVEEILIRDGDASELEGHAIALSFSPDTAIDECLQPPLLFENGEFITGKALDPKDVEYLTFPEPIGNRKVYPVYRLPDYGMKVCIEDRS